MGRYSASARIYGAGRPMAKPAPIKAKKKMASWTSRKVDQPTYDTKAKHKGAFALINAANKKGYKNSIVSKVAGVGQKIADRIVYGKKYKPAAKNVDIQKSLGKLTSSLSDQKYDANTFKKSLPKSSGKRPKYVPTAKLVDI